jgi:hypothetical protein
MKILHKIIVVGIVLFVGVSLSNKFSYNFLVMNGDKKWFIFIQHPIKFIANMGRLER